MLSPVLLDILATVAEWTYLAAQELTVWKTMQLVQLAPQVGYTHYKYIHMRYYYTILFCSNLTLNYRILLCHY